MVQIHDAYSGLVVSEFHKCQWPEFRSIFVGTNTVGVKLRHVWHLFCCIKLMMQWRHHGMALGYVLLYLESLHLFVPCVSSFLTKEISFPLELCFIRNSPDKVQAGYQQSSQVKWISLDFLLQSIEFPFIGQGHGVQNKLAKFPLKST